MRQLQEAGILGHLAQEALAGGGIGNVLGAGVLAPQGPTEGGSAAGRVLHSVLGGHQVEELMRSYSEELIEQGLEKGLARGREEGMQQGLTRGRAEYILRILTARGVRADEAARQRILSCSDLVTLDRWFDRALHATTLSDVLDDLAP